MGFRRSLPPLLLLMREPLASSSATHSQPSPIPVPTPGHGVTASYKWTRDEFVVAQISYVRQRTRPKFKGVRYLILVFLWIYAIWYAHPGVWQWFVYAEAAALSFIALGGDTTLTWLFTRKWKKAQQRESDNFYQFTPDTIAMQTRFGNSTVKWDAFIKILEVKRGFLLFQQPRLFYWVPFHAFEGTADIEKVRELIVRSEVPFTRANV